MAKGISISVEGLDRIKKKFGQLPENIMQELDAELAAGANDFVNRAVQKAPVDKGVLRNNITFTRIGEANYEVVSGARYAAYLEFGTITKVKVPTDLVEYAIQFKGKGLRTTGGITPQPYFFIQREPVRKKLNSNLKSMLKRAMK